MREPRDELFRAPRPFAFWYHYNKPASRERGLPHLSLHFHGACHLIRGIVCKVPTKSRERSTQPKLVIAGKATEILVDGEGVAWVA